MNLLGELSGCEGLFRDLGRTGGLCVRVLDLRISVGGFLRLRFDSIGSRSLRLG